MARTVLRGWLTAEFVNDTTDHVNITLLFLVTVCCSCLSLVSQLLTGSRILKGVTWTICTLAKIHAIYLATKDFNPVRYVASRKNLLRLALRILAALSAGRLWCNKWRQNRMVLRIVWSAGTDSLDRSP